MHPRTLGQWLASISVMTDQVETPTKNVQGEAITKYCWSGGKNSVSNYLERDGLCDVADDAFKIESGKTNISLTIASVAGK